MRADIWEKSSTPIVGFNDDQLVELVSNELVELLPGIRLPIQNPDSLFKIERGERHAILQHHQKDTKN